MGPAFCSLIEGIIVIEAGHPAVLLVPPSPDLRAYRLNLTHLDSLLRVIKDDVLEFVKQVGISANTVHKN